MGGFWEANIYCNNEWVTLVKIKSNFSLKQIKDICGNSIPKDDQYYIISIV